MILSGNRLKFLSAGLLVSLSLIGQADDTDIYYLTNTANSAPPMLMLNFDYRPNLGNHLCTAGPDCLADLGAEINSYINVAAGNSVKSFDAMRATMASLLDDFEGIQVGLMMSHDDNCTGSSRSGPSKTKCSNGGYILRGFKELQAGDANGAKAELMTILYDIPTPQGNVSHQMQGKEVYFEFFRYLSGQGIYNGHLGYKDFGDNDKNTNLDSDFPGASWDTSIESGSNYISPLTGAQDCTNIYAVNILFQVSNQDDDSDDAIQDSLANGGMALTGNNIDFDDVIRYMFQNDVASSVDGNQNVQSWFFATQVNTTTNGYAEAGGTQEAMAWSDSGDGYQQLRLDLLEIGRSVLSESSTFVSASVPVNVFNRAEIDDNLFIALFSVDATGAPQWPGNLKKLNIQETVIDGVPTLQLVDTNGVNAVASDGKIRFDALTLWTDPGTLPAPPVTPLTPEEEFMVAGKDGRFVTRGGAGQQIPEATLTNPPIILGGTDLVSTSRRILLEPTSGNTLLEMEVDLDTAATLLVEMGLGLVNDVVDVLYWLFGIDPATGNPRDWSLADSVHSRPTPINYGALGSHTQENPDIRILMGSNDGLFHMFRNTLADGTESGVESWAFLPRSMLGELPRLADNTIGTPPHIYGLDGEVVLFTEDLNNDGTLDASGGDKVYAIVGQRRGGQNYYALDISDPDAPSLLWTLEGGTGDFTELALSFSTPQIVKVQYGAGNIKNALLFGGGYNGGWDLGTGLRVGKDLGDAPDTPDKGNAIFLVDIDTGALIWKVTYDLVPAATSTEYSVSDMTDSFPSGAQALDTNDDGYHDRAYIGDSGGAIWRLDFPRSTVTDNRASAWQAVKFSDLDGVAANEDRRFFHRPDIVHTTIGGTPVDMLITGSGDRAAPTDTTVDNWIYAIKDYNTQTLPDPTTWTPITHADLGDVTADCFTTSNCSADLSKGWKLQLSEAGEKMLSTPVTVRGSVFFTTYLPGGEGSAGACSPSIGGGRAYNVSLFDGSPEKNRNIIDDNGNQSPSTHNDRFMVLASPGIPSDVVALSPSFLLLPDLSVERTNTGSYWKTYWYQKGVENY